MRSPVGREPPASDGSFQVHGVDAYRSTSLCLKGTGRGACALWKDPNVVARVRQGQEGVVVDEASVELAAVAIAFPALSDDRVALRPWQRDDAAAMLDAFTDPVFDHFSDWAPRTAADVVAHLARQEERRQEGELIDLAIVEAGQPAIALGGVSLHGIDLQVHLRASIGYWLRPAARGRGLATRSVNLLAAWAFAELQLARLELTCGPDNSASQRVAEGCGFQREGLLRSHLAFKGGRRDTLVYSRLP